MLQSPAKRRKTSETTSVAATNRNTNAPNRSTPTTPTRASYLSPTKASLARSHPHLVSHNHVRSATEPRGRLLRNELLSGRTTNTSQAQKQQPPSIAEPEDGWIDPKDTTQHETEANSSIRTAISSRRAPLQQRQPTAQSQAQEESTSIDVPPQHIIPKLVTRSEVGPRAASRPRSNEPELPPTPVELGLDAPPERPRGLSSSSPRGSKSETGRRRARVRDVQNTTSSPLKPKAGPPAMDDLESRPDVPQEALESHAPMTEAVAEDEPEELKRKTQILRKLRDELSQLQAQTAKVEGALNTNDLTEDIGTDDSPTQLLKSGHRYASSLNANFEQEVSSKDSEPPYCDLFAPGNLQLKSKTLTKMIKGHVKVIHHISVAAPSPWPSNIFSADLEVTTDAEDVRVEKVVWLDVMKGQRHAPGIQNELHDWIQDRLKSQLHHLDVGGLIWGIGMYFNASVERARTFKTLAHKYKAAQDDGESNDEEDHGSQTGLKEGVITEEDATALTRYLTKSQLVFEVMPDEKSAMTTRRSKKAAPKIMATWKIEPTWHGEVMSMCEIAPSGIPDSAQESVTELFDRVRMVGGFEKAFGAVWDMIGHSVGQGEERSHSEVEKGPAKKRKRFS